jgi:hypothetical protein
LVDKLFLVFLDIEMSPMRTEGGCSYTEGRCGSDRSIKRETR